MYTVFAFLGGLRRGEVRAIVGDMDDCEEWEGYRNTKGYGMRRFRGKMARAHRVAWEMAHGPIPPWLPVVMHLCDNPACVKVSHLALGTPRINTRDSWAKGRGRGNGHGNPIPSRRKLSAADREAIRTSEGLTQRELAVLFGVSQPTISYVRKGDNGT